MNEAVVQFLCSQGLITPEVIEDAQRHRATHGGSLVEHLATAPSIDEEALAECLALEAGTLLLDLGQGELDQDAVKMVSAEDAWARCLIPVAIETRGDSICVRLAMADPLDTEALGWFEQTTSCPAMALGATVTGVQEAIAKYLGPRPNTLPPLLSEPTRRVAGRKAPQGGKIGTVPSHRIGSEASVEQRVEAMVLALVAKGVLTRAEYEETLLRILRRSAGAGEGSE